MTKICCVPHCGETAWPRMRSLELLTNGFAQDHEGLSLSLPGGLLPCLNGGGPLGLSEYLATSAMLANRNF